MNAKYENLKNQCPYGPNNYNIDAKKNSAIGLDLGEGSLTMIVCNDYCNHRK